MGTIAQIFETGKQKANKGHFMNLVMLARVDGQVDSSEQGLLNRIAQRLSLTEEQVKEIVSNSNDYQMIPPASEAERMERFVQLMQMMTVDGIIDESEVRLVSKYGIALGYSEAKVDKTFEAVKGLLADGKNREEIIEALS